jgi:hypothetical protein
MAILETGVEIQNEEIEAVEALTTYLLEAENLSDFHVTSFDELWLARQALQRLHAISAPEPKRSNSKASSETYMVSQARTKPYMHVYDSVNSAIIRFYQNGESDIAQEEYLNKHHSVGRSGNSRQTTSSESQDLLQTLKDKGACSGLDPNRFFTENTSEQKGLKEICDNCPVEQQCLGYALEQKVNHGFWGGKSERQRRGILARRRKGKLQLAD